MNTLLYLKQSQRQAQSREMDPDTSTAQRDGQQLPLLRGVRFLMFPLLKMATVIFNKMNPYSKTIICFSLLINYLEEYKSISIAIPSSLITSVKIFLQILCLLNG